ncbi:Mannan polymerase II complex anp1 subunit [Choanephora cucurbitarum]|uniref:Mannan polymerase II complex anp1 subunit n=1 Tax=Choanephora cucurbitarum TaxID=101091 RepID=A0A1C7NJL5_9FUNG|nr:Mannan polymerase II complex anp1 subunit [Choanephora cucurbitarum]
MSFIFNSNKSPKKILVISAIIALFFILYLSSLFSFTIQQNDFSCAKLNDNTSHLLPLNIPSLSISATKNSLFTDFNRLSSSPTKAKQKKEKVLVLTPLKDAERYLDRYFELLDRTSYPNHLISIGFLVSDSSDNTLGSLERHIHQLQSRNKWNWQHQPFDSIKIYQKDFDFELPSERRHTYEMQPLRRSIMARSRNWLLSAAMRADISWVAWIDVDVVEYPVSIFEDLMAADGDVVVPNCLLQREDHAFWAYDKNNWQETDESRKIQETLEDDFVLLEGYYEFPTHRYLMVDMPTDVPKDHKVPLDGVGATFTLVKAHVHREGANFPAYTYQHQVETEGFAKMAKSMGFSVYGLPGYIIYHIQND